jgi:hypothetical protein
MVHHVDSPCRSFVVQACGECPGVPSSTEGSCGAQSPSVQRSNSSCNIATQPLVRMHVDPSPSVPPVSMLPGWLPGSSAVCRSSCKEESSAGETNISLGGGPHNIPFVFCAFAFKTLWALLGSSTACRSGCMEGSSEGGTNSSCSGGPHATLSILSSLLSPTLSSGILFVVRARCLARSKPI